MHHPEQPDVASYPKFHGLPFEDVRDFINSYERFGRTFAWNQADYLNSLNLVLKDGAGQWHEAAYTQHPTWAAMKNALITTFGKSDLDYKLAGPQASVDLLEDPMTFVANTIKMVQVSKPNATLEDKLEKLFDRLPFELQASFLENRPNTIDKFIERLKNAQRKKLLRQQTKVADGKQITSTTTQVTERPAVISYPAFPFPEQSARSSLNETAVIQAITNLSSQMGQLMQQVNTRQPSQQTNNTQGQSQGRTSDGRVICNYCKKPGHILAKCRTRQ